MLPLLLLAAWSGALAPQDEGPLAARVSEALDRGAAALRAMRTRGGGWPESFPSHPGGITALSLHALLHAGASPQAPEIQRALAFLRRRPHASTYASSLRLLVEADLGAAGDRAAAREALRFLLANRAADGLWGYPSRISDLSNTQFAVLALGAASDLGLEVPATVVEEVAAALRRVQARDGGFPYRAGGGSTLTMTASSLGGLAILRALGAEIPERSWKQAVGRYENLIRSMPERGSPQQLGGTYHLYALERFGTLAGVDEIAGRDWYALGAESLLQAQAPDGSWGRQPVETAFAMLFLSRASGSLRIAVTHGGRAGELPAAEAVALAQEVPRLTPWLVAGPWNARRVPDPDRLDPKENAFQGGHRWRRVALLAGSPTPLDRVLEPFRKPGSWLLAGRLRWNPPSLDGRPATAPLPLTLWVAGHAQWSLHLDGRPVGQRSWRPASEYQAVPLDLPPGEHLLLLRLDRSRPGGTLDLRWSDREGRPLPPLVGWSAGAAARE